jgi:hypothetical protein
MEDDVTKAEEIESHSLRGRTIGKVGASAQQRILCSPRTSVAYSVLQSAHWVGAKVCAMLRRRERSQGTSPSEVVVARTEL